jgi:hypothetical protein
MDIQFLHLSFQEFLAAKYLYNEGKDNKNFLKHIIRKESWRNTLLLLLGFMSLDRKGPCTKVIQYILEQGDPEEETEQSTKKSPEQTKVESSHYLWLLASEALTDIIGRRGKNRSSFSELVEEVRKRLLEIFENSDQVKHRFEAGKVLGLLGIPCISQDKMVKVPPGKFIRGSEDKDARDREKPTRSIYLNNFKIGIYPVTNFEYARFLEAKGYEDDKYWDKEGWKWKEEEKISEPLYWRDRKWNLPNFPVVAVSWYEAAAYTKWLSSFTKEPYRLPYEAEWEKAARGIDGRKYPWGNKFNSELCNSGQSGFYRTSPVGIYPLGKSHFGCLDMAGNVWEWCMDWFDDTYYKDSPQRNPKGPAKGVSRVVRGGGW